MPILSLGYLAVENGQICPDIFALFFSDLFFDGRRIARLCVIKHIKVDGVTFALCFRQDAVFSCFLSFNGCVMLRHASEHIRTLSNVNNDIVDLDAVNARMIVFIGIPISFQPLIHIFCVAIRIQTPSFPVLAGASFSALLLVI